MKYKDLSIMGFWRSLIFCFPALNKAIMSEAGVSTCHQEGTISRIDSQCVEGGEAEDGTCLDSNDITE